MLQSFADNIAASGLNRWIAETYWLWPVLEIVHFIGLSLMFGALLTIDARLLGMFGTHDADAGSGKRLARLVWIGFCVNLASGTLFFIGDPMRYSINIGFQLKMLLILIAGLNLVVFQLRAQPLMADRDPASPAPAGARLVAAFSLLIWVGVLLLGRLIPYVGTG